MHIHMDKKFIFLFNYISCHTFDDKSQEVPLLSLAL